MKDPNRSASGSEAAVLAANVREDMGILAALDQSLSRASDLLNSAEAELRVAQDAVTTARTFWCDIATSRKQVEARISSARGLLHPVRRIPAEVLELIFVAALGPCNPRVVADAQRQYPKHLGFLFASVCRYWRRVALGSTALWSRIRIDFSSSNSTMAWQRYADVCLERAGHRRLDVAIMCWPLSLSTPEYLDPDNFHFHPYNPNPVQNAGMAYLFPETSWASAFRVYIAKLFARSRTFGIGIHNPRWMELALEWISGLDAPELQSLAILISVPRRPVRTKERTLRPLGRTPKLRHFDAAGLDFEIDSDHLGRSTLPVTSAALTAPWKMSWHEIKHGSSWMPGLRTLSITAGSVTGPGWWCPLQQLESLELNLASYLVDIDHTVLPAPLPKLSTLSLDVSRHDPTISLWPIVAALCGAAFPNVRHLTIKGVRDGPTALAIWPTNMVEELGVLQYVENLTLQDISVWGSVLESLGMQSPVTGRWRFASLMSLALVDLHCDTAAANALDALKRVNVTRTLAYDIGELEHRPTLTIELKRTMNAEVDVGQLEFAAADVMNDWLAQ